MGMLDSIFRSARGGSAESMDAADTPAASPTVHHGLLDAAIAMLTNRSTGGLAGLLEKFRSAGLGTEAGSWVSTGPNQPVSPDQVHSALGTSVIDQLAQKFGISPQQVSAHLSQILPELVDHATPEGQIPQDHGTVASMMAMLKKKLLSTGA
jgi:uncharacterized protein YidB (DUF937 family)